MAQELPRRLQWVVWGGLTVVLVAVLGLFLNSKSRRPSASASALPVYGQVADFKLTNQDGRTVSLADLRGRVWIADIIFTRCPGPCVAMTRQMNGLQASLPPGQSVTFVSLTADPEFDTPAILKQYAQRFEVNQTNWHFLTGPRDQILRLATKDLLLVVVENQPGERSAPMDLFLHSTKLILVDQSGRLRGIYDGENPAANAQILADLQTLTQPD